MKNKILKLLMSCAALGASIAAPFAHAQTTIIISDPGKRFPIALPQLCLSGGASNAPREIPRITAKDLDLSGYFDVLDPASYVESPGKCVGPEEKAYTDWSMIKAEWLVRGNVTGSGNRMTVQLYLHDVPGQRIVMGKEYTGDQSELSKIAHKFANEIMKYVTGEYGPFGSQIAFSGRIGRFKELFLMDMDGSNIRQLTNERGLALSPAWSPNGSTLLYTSYRSRVPDLFLLDVASGRSRAITRNPAMEVGGTFAKDGSSIITAVTGDRGSSLVAMSQEGSVIRRITEANRAIDVSPSFSPDGSQMVFCSDRAGKPQIYVMGRDGGAARRISFVTSDYCTSPVWSPKGDRIAYVCRADGGFQLFVSDPEGQNAVQLTSGGNNEDPDWSPDGRYIAYASTFGKRGGYDLALMRVVKGLEGSNIKQLTFSRTDDLEPAWGPLP